MTPNQVATEIQNHINNRNWGIYGWYFGIATDPRDRLFSDHNVEEHGGQWVYRQADTEQDARDAEVILLERFPKGHGGPGGGDHPLYVYAYKIESHTKE